MTTILSFQKTNTHLLNNAIVQLNNVTLENVKHINSLGAYLNDKLRWHKYVEETARIIYRKIPMLCKVPNMLPQKL